MPSSAEIIDLAHYRQKRVRTPRQSCGVVWVPVVFVTWWMAVPAVPPAIS